MAKVIIDDKGKVVDRASTDELLSVGYKKAGVAEGDDIALELAGYKKIDVNGPVFLDDLINDISGTVIPNAKARAQRDLKGLQRALVETSILRDKAFQLGFTELVTELDIEITQYNNDISARNIIIAN